MIITLCTGRQTYSHRGIFTLKVEAFYPYVEWDGTLRSVGKALGAVLLKQESVPGNHEEQKIEVAIAKAAAGKV